MTRVLSLVWYKVLPPHFGGQKGIALFSKYLARKVSLDMLCADTNVSDGMEGYGVMPLLPASKTQFIDPGVWRQICTTIEKGNYTHLMIEHCYYGWMGKLLKKKYGLPLIVHSHNIEYLRFKQLGKWWWPALERIERTAHRTADLSLFKTEEDLKTAVNAFNLDPSKCMEVPYGLEQYVLPTTEAKAEARKKLELTHGIAPGKKILLFNGTLDYEPNADAVRQIVLDIVPRLKPDYVVIVCGRVLDERFIDIKELRAPNYIYAGYVDEIETYFKGVDLFINPVTTGGGVKVKVMEALSYGLPVVSYASGSIGIHQHLTGKQLILVEDNDVDAIIASIESIKYQSTVDSSFFQYYHWESITERVAERIRLLGR
jgi:glycosyltransferase involved in cell wall biosynthesis